MLDSNNDNMNRLTELRNEIMEEEDPDKVQSMIDELLSLDPNNPFGKYMKWCGMDEDESEENLNLLYEAIDAVRLILDDSDKEFGIDMRPEFASMLADLASVLYIKNELDKAYDVAEEFMKYDTEGNLIGRMVYYSTLTKRCEYDKLSKAADSDDFKTPLSEFSRALALFELEGPSEDASDALLEAISTERDMIFHVMGLWEIDEDSLNDDLDEEEAAYMDEFQMQVGILTELWSETEERLAFLSSVAFSFGYLTGRISEPEDLEMLEEGYHNLGCFDAMSTAREELLAMLDDGRDEFDVDEEAIMRFREIRAQGLFS